MDIVKKALESLREKLLDTTFRNKLLNFKHAKRGSLRAIDELPNHLVKILLVEGKSMRFIPIDEPKREELIEHGYIHIDPETKEETKVKKDPTAEEWAEVKGFVTSYDVPNIRDTEVQSKHEDSDIQTLLYPYEMESNLKYLYQISRSSISETGANILFLCFGFLEWVDHNDRKAFAPLISIPVTLTKGKLNIKKMIYEYSVSHSGEETIANLSLKEKLKNDFGLALPDIAEDFKPEVYFKEVKHVISSKPEWKLRRFITLSTLNFRKMLMYRDLDPDNWPDGHSILEHSIASKLLGGIGSDEDGESDPSNTYSFLDEYEIDNVEEIHDSCPLLFEADSSQHSAIIDAIKGKDLTIEGPPGTGKSQTISNLIGAAIGNGKSVLFMSEKQAALDVVFDKLTNIGLGDFCLNIHSHKVKKSTVIESIGSRIRNRYSYQNPEELSHKIIKYEKLKKTLNEYASTINSKWESTDYTINQILNKATRYAEYLSEDIVSEINIDVDKIDRSYVEQIEEDFEILIKLTKTIIENKDGIESIDEGAWYGMNNSSIREFDYGRLINSIQEFNSSLMEYFQYEKELAEHYSFIQTNPDFTTEPEIVEDLEKLSFVEGSIDFDALATINISNLSHLTKCLEKYLFLQEKKSSLSKRIDFDLIKPFLPPNSAKPIPVYLSSRNCEDVSLDGLKETLNDLDIVQENIESIATIQQQVTSIAGDEFDFGISIHGIANLSKLIEVVGSIPYKSITMRSPLLERDNAIEKLPELKNKINELLNLRYELDAIYEINSIPSTHQITAVAAEVLDGGLFKYLQGDYWAARREIKSYAKNTHIKFGKLSSNFGKIYLYRRALDELEDSELPDCFGDYIQGCDTDIKGIEGVIKWYSKVKEVFGTGFGKTFHLRDKIKHIDDSTLGQLNSLCINKQDLEVVNYTSNLINKISSNTDIEITNPDAEIHGENKFIQLARNEISSVVDFIEEAAILSDGSYSVVDILSIYEEVKEFSDKCKIWEREDSNEVFFKSPEPLTFDYDGAMAKSTVNLAQAVIEDLNDKVLSGLILESPTNETFKNFEGIKDKLKALFHDSQEGFDLFKNALLVDIDRWTVKTGKSLESIIQRNEFAIESEEDLYDWVQYIQKVHSFNDSELKSLIDYLDGIGIYDKAAEIFKAIVFDRIGKDILSKNPDLENFSAISHNRMINNFAEIDNELMALQKGRICFNSDQKSKMAPGVSSGYVAGFTESPLLNHNVKLKTRHAPIRRLIKNAPITLASLKPCFMMSPMSVAQYLSPGGIEFDMLVIDEASQIKPEDALGSIARCKQVVIVGDPKQLPPENRFETKNDGDGMDDAVIAEVQESILDAAISILPLRQLRWHYRSRHQDLIAFSNHFFYNDNLVIFNSAKDSSDDLGIRYSKIDNGTFVDHKNFEEARVIAKSVRNHMLNNPGESLGVVAMNIKQSNQIREEIDILAKKEARDGNTKFSKILDNNDNLDVEPFFVKNLSNVQGDERDVMYISITYGPVSIGGKVYKRFGDVNKESGWRFLNVLLTRSKKRMRIFSSIDSGDVPNTGSRGVVALNKFLKFCETGEISRTKSDSGREPDSDFEISVMEMLDRHGFECVPQVGEAGFFIDVAVRDPNKPGTFLMAIECDGRTYHSSKSARDRDRLKQQILEGLGWNVRRIWSPDWFRNPQSTIRPIIKELNKMKSPEVVKEDAEHISEEEDIVRIIDEENKLSKIVDEYKHVGIELREKLIKFNNDVILKTFPNTEERRRLLNQYTLDALIEHQPYDEAEYLTLIPEHLREHIDVHERAKYLNDVLGIISSSLENKD